MFPKFFPEGTFDDLEVKWFTQHLAAMNERPLSEQGNGQRGGPNIEAYRFLWLRSFDHPVVVRLQRENDQYRVAVKELDGKGGYKPGKPMLDKTRDLTREEWLQTMREIDECSFWKMRTRNSSRTRKTV